MLLPEFERMLDVVLPSVSPTSLTLTQAPDHFVHLNQLLERALLSGVKSRTRLTRIELSKRRFPGLGEQFWHVPVEDSGLDDVVRLFFEP